MMSQLTIQIKTKSAEVYLYPIDICPVDVMQGGRWKTINAVRISQETAKDISDHLNGEYSEYLIFEMIPNMFIEGGASKDDIEHFETGEIEWSWEILVDGQSATYKSVCEAMESLPSQAHPIDIARQR